MLALTNGTILTMTHGIIENGTILIDEGKIQAIGHELNIPVNSKIIDVAGKIITPGLIDSHCHVGIIPEGLGWGHDDVNEMTDPITPHLRALDAIHPEDAAFPELVSAGVTTILTGPGSANLIGGQWVCLKTVPKPSIEEMVLLEPAGMKMALGENPRRVYSGLKRQPSTRMANAAVLRSALVDAQNYQHRWEKFESDLGEYYKKTEAGNSDLQEPTTPDRDLKMEALVKVLKREMKARVHAHRADDILTAIRISEEFNLDLTIEHATEGHLIADIIAEKGIPCTSGPIFTSRIKYELKNKTPKNPGILSKAGVKVAIQTDDLSGVQYINIHAGLAVREGMPRDEALKAITIYAAEIIGVADRVGSLEVGKDADVVVFNGDPLDIQSKAEIVIVDGEIVFEA